MDRPNDLTAETELVRRAHANDRSAQQELYLRTVERIFRLLLRMTGNEIDASDLVQETYLRAFTRLGQFDGRSAFATWLYRLAVNEALQGLKRKRRSPGRATGADLAATQTSSVSRHDVTLDVEEALAELEPQDRAVLLLRHQEGLDYRAIADTMGCSMGTVASRLNRARGRLRRYLNAGYGATEETPAANHLTNVEIHGVGLREPRVGSADK